ncbi:MAG: hypothetical protein U1E97_01410 [Alphaproteobacteria bacterium]
MRRRHDPRLCARRAPAVLQRLAGVRSQVLDLMARGAPADLVLDRIVRELDAALQRGRPAGPG